MNASSPPPDQGNGPVANTNFGSTTVPDGALFGISPDGRAVLPVETPTQARDAGIAKVEAATDKQGRAVIDHNIHVVADTGRPFSVNDFRDRLPLERANLIGARILAAARRGEIHKVGYTTANHAAGHGRALALWQIGPSRGGGDA